MDINYDIITLFLRKSEVANFAYIIKTTWHVRTHSHYNNKIAKNELPSLAAFLKTLPQKCWPQYLGSYTDYTDVRYFAVPLYIYKFMYAT